MLVTKSAIDALQRGFSQLFRTACSDSNIWGTEIATTIPSTHGTEVHGWMQRILKMNEWLGPRVVKNLATHSYTLTNKTFEETVGVPVNAIEDDSLGVYNPLFQELGRVSAKWPDQQLKAALQAGVTSPGFDGQNFFSATHDLNPAGVQSNNFTSSQLNATNFNAVRSAMSSLTGEDGEPLGVMPGLLVVPPQLEKAALEIVAAERNSSGASNVLVGSARVLVVPELADAPATWYLMDVSRAIKPLVWQLRQSPELASKTSVTDENVFNLDQFVWGIKARGVAGYGPWWLAARAIA